MALRFAVDSCTAAEIVGWVDDDGPVRSVEVEVNGDWACSLCPCLHRRDLAAAGYGDGRRGFAVSLAQRISAAPPGQARITLKCNGAVFYEGVIEVPADREVGNVERLSARLDQVEARIAEWRHTMSFERYRIEAALFAAEDLTGLRDEFLEARATPEYQAVFKVDNPLVSVCVTTMNRAELLVERALASLRAQTYANLQIIVVGDHCTDDTAQRIARLGDQRISFVNRARRGPYPRPGLDRWRVAGTHPGNLALQFVEGEFVTHLDEDDSYQPERIEVLLQKIRETRADLVFHRFWWEQPDGSWTEVCDGSFEHGQTGTGSILYHRYLARIPWDVYAYRLGEPEDWNRLRKFKQMRARIEFVPALLSRWCRFPPRGPFVAEPDEEFLE